MGDKFKTVEPQYQILFDVIEKHGRSQFGLMANESWNQDPRRTLFTMARYKFVSKLLEGRKHALEIGCADAFASRIVQQTVEKLTVTDFDQVFLDDVKQRMNPNWSMDVVHHDLTKGPVPGEFDAVYAMDVLEHIDPSWERKFIENSILNLTDTGVCIFGMPSLESQTYASPQSKAGHVNCKSGNDFKSLMNEYFNTVFVFSMNDEVVHTGYYPMAHYLIAVCSHKK